MTKNLSNLPRPKYSFLVLLFVVFLNLIGGCGETAPETPEAEAPQVEVEGFRYTKVPGGARIVSGLLVNTSTTQIANAQIRISLYDKDNLLLTTFNIPMADIAPGEKKPFRQPLDLDDTLLDAIVSAKVKNVLTF